MKLQILSPAKYNPGDKTQIEHERLIDDVSFNVHKFTNRPYPNDKSKIVIFPAFAEFGCETLIPLYCIPYLMQNKCRGKYSIVMGWYGRDYLYRHLVDEFWELKEDYQYLREYCLAFHHSSKNLKKVEKNAEDFGVVVGDKAIANVICYPKIPQCIVSRNHSICQGRVVQFENYQTCQKCNAMYPRVGYFDNCQSAVKRAKWLPMPSQDKMKIAKDTLPENAVAVVSRGRKCYGRNLPLDFYERLIWLLQDMGYNPVWLGEKITTQPCPCSHIMDLSRDSNARDLELTLAYVANMKFTIQFWTASTRLAGLVGTPYILFESPDQIWGNGQEGMRLHLTTKGKKKLVVAHYRQMLEDTTAALRVAKSAIREVELNDFSTVLGMVEDEDCVRSMIRSCKNNITWF